MRTYVRFALLFLFCLLKFLGGRADAFSLFGERGSAELGERGLIRRANKKISKVVDRHSIVISLHKLKDRVRDTT